MFNPHSAVRSATVRFVLTGILLLTACGRTDGPPGPAGNGGDDSSDEGRVPPIAEFLGWGDGAPGSGPNDQVQRQERLVQELVAGCMRAQGFEYVPEEASESRGKAGPFSLPPAEFARQYGYGITTIDSSDLAGPQADPNEAIVEGLSPQAQTAYRHALYGEAGARPLPGWIEPIPGAAPQGNEKNVAEQDAGCYQNAQDEVYGPVGAGSDEGLAAAFAELNEELTALENRIDRDPRVEAARTDWAGCMSEAGHTQYGGPNDPPEVIRDRFTELTGLNAAPVDGRAPGVAQTAELLELRDHERAVAQADLSCRGPYDETVTEVRFELEEEFISDHRDLLERYRELAGVAGGEG